MRDTFLAPGVFSFFINLLTFVGPPYLWQIYDQVLTSRNEMTLIVLTAIALGMSAVFRALELVHARPGPDRRPNRPVGQRHDGRRHVRQHARLPVKGKGVSKALRDLDSVREVLTGAGLIAFFDAPWVPRFQVVVFLFHPLLGLVALVGALIILGLALASELATRSKLGQALKASSGADGIVPSNLHDAEAVHARACSPVERRAGLTRTPR